MPRFVVPKAMPELRSYLGERLRYGFERSTSPVHNLIADAKFEVYAEALGRLVGDEVGFGSMDVLAAIEREYA